MAEAQLVADLPTGRQLWKPVTVDRRRLSSPFGTRCTARRLPHALQPTIPHLTRSLHRCLKQARQSPRLPQIEARSPPNKNSKLSIGYPSISPGCAQQKASSIRRDRPNVEIRLVALREGRSSDRRAFLEALILTVPYRLHTVLTDNGIQFAFPKSRWLDSAIPGPPFRSDRTHGIEHRLNRA